MTKYFISVNLMFAIFAASSNIACAEIYKQVDAEGRVTYSNVKIKGAKKLDLEPADTNFGTNPGGAKKQTPSNKASTPSSFPNVDANTQKQRDSGRKEILQNELAAEKTALENAKKAYSEGESSPEVYHKSRQVTTKNADGSTSTKTVTDTFRNVPKFDEKMQNLQADVDVHQRNIELLEQEISNLN